MKQIEECQSGIETLQNTFKRGTTRPYKFRIEQLKALKRLVDENKTQIAEALMKDFKGEPEAYLEIDLCTFTIDFALKNLHKWMQPKKKTTSLPFKLDSAQVIPEPRGIVFIIGPWNYPLALLIDPLVGAISAGNCAFMKASSRVPHTSELLESLFPLYLNSDAFLLAHTNAKVANHLLENVDFDLIFFTGSYQTGQAVYELAAKRFTPVLMELGGKSPCIVSEHADWKSTVNRISWGKYLNAGQTCIAPDFVLATTQAIKDGLIERFIRVATDYSEQYFNQKNASRIVSDDQFLKLVNFLNEIPPEWKVYVGNVDKEKRIFEPAIIVVPATAVKEFIAAKNFQFDLLKNEIFGPILPILEVSNVEEAIQVANIIEPHPLTLYIFSRNQNEIDLISQETSSGSICINDVMMQVMNPNLPFGGVGKSGIGKYHGKYSFEAFSHFKSVLHRTVKDEWISSHIRYPPNLFKRHKLLSKILFLH